MNTIKQIGHIAVGTRFRILTDRLMQDAGKIYKSLDIDFEPRWFTVFYLLNQEPPMTITELSEKLGYSQPAVTQIVNSLLAKQLICPVKKGTDSRKKIVTVTDKGKELLLKLIPVWQDIENAVKELLDATGYDILHIIGKLESELDNKNIYSRVMEKRKDRQLGEVEIIEFEPKFKKDFRELNYEWLKKYFEIEAKDKLMLNNPEREIMNKGGFILFAKHKGRISGTVAVIKHDKKTYELAKMAVTENAQGKQIGKRLALEAIQRARKLNCSVIFLESNSSLLPALNLYKKIGFIEVPMRPDSDYKRATLRMELNLKKSSKQFQPTKT